MKTTFYFLLLSFVCCVLLGSCSKSVDGNGNIVRKDIVIENFNEIELSGITDIVYRALPDENPSFVIESDENIVDLIEVGLSGYKLTVKSPKNIRPTRLTIYVNSPSLSSLTSNGIGNIELVGAIAGDELKIELKGSGDLNAGNIIYKNLLLDVSGNSNVYLSGQVEKATYEIKGNANVRAFALETSELECKVTGNTKIQVHAIKSLSAEIKGMGRIEYIQEPQLINSKIKGVGSLRKVSNSSND